MATLYYGNGVCTIEGPDIRAVQISYRCAIEITDKTSDSFAISEGNNIIVVFPIGVGILKDLFDYVGEFRVLSVTAANDNLKKVPVTIKKVMDYSELLNSKSEDLTVISDDLSSGYVAKKKISRTKLKKDHIPNIDSSYFGNLFKKDGEQYAGKVKVKFYGSIITDDKEAKDLFIKKDNKLITTRQLKVKTKTTAKKTVSGGY